MARRFRRDRRGATAIAVALMLVPMIISAGAAVDYARISAARAQLQAAADAAALAGVGTYENAAGQTTVNGPVTTSLANAATARSIATATFSDYAASLANFITLGAPTATAGCTPPGSYPLGRSLATVCGKPPYGTCPLVTASGAEAGSYCVSLGVSGTLQTSLLSILVPNIVISVSALATSPIPTTPITQANFPNSNTASAADNNATYAYGVPYDAAGKPNYAALPQPTSACAGVIKNPDVVSTLCPYYQIANSKGTASTGQNPLQLYQDQPIAFLFDNVTGGSSNYAYKKEPDGGYCPEFTLYGSISQEAGISVPLSDSTNAYSSAYEMLGEPPSYSSSAADELAETGGATGQPFGANHLITGFQVAKGVGVGNGATNPQVENCPYYYYNYYHTGGGTYSYTVTTGGVTTPYTGTSNSYAQWNATYYPSNSFYEDSPTPVNGPPVVGGCTPNTVVGPDGVSVHGWNYTANNNLYSGGCDPGAYSPATQTPTGVKPAQQTANFSNCALLIEPLGTGVSGLPDSYTVAQRSVLDQATGNTVQQTYLAPDYGTYLPGATKTWPPESTAHRCYDPAAAYTAPTAESPALAAYDAAGAPIAGHFDVNAAGYDAIANPALGTVICNQTVPQSYGLYWNDLGSTETDDLGYWNAIVFFTCSVPNQDSFGPPVLAY